MRLFGGEGPVESWITPKAEKGLASSVHGKGIFAIAPITKGEIVIVKAGHIIDKKTLDLNKDVINGSEAQISDDLYIAPPSKQEFEPSMGYLNHSCDPNVGFGGNIVLVAMRDIAAGEEMTMDYAMMMTEPKFTLQCNCKALSHRPIITGNDWQIPALQRKYAGYFSWYIEQKIKTPDLQT
jgi:hypothetical protein